LYVGEERETTWVRRREGEKKLTHIPKLGACDVMMEGGCEEIMSTVGPACASGKDKERGGYGGG
jgi:hypothetical protein